ncbi:MAG: hypothetical protein HYX75_12610 [Acidobacteria bacterium]|nr:hypothetical protein [Acidobacteriota bacterium]
MSFLGGSAFAMARDVSEGYILLNPVIMRKMTVPELQQLRFELDKVIRETRSSQPPQDDTMAQQQRNRKILRIQQAMLVIDNQISMRR